MVLTEKFHVSIISNKKQSAEGKLNYFRRFYNSLPLLPRNNMCVCVMILYKNFCLLFLYIQVLLSLRAQ